MPVVVSGAGCWAASAGESAAADRGGACAGTATDVGGDGVAGGELGGGVFGDRVPSRSRNSYGVPLVSVAHTRVASLRATAQVAWMWVWERSTISRR